MKKTFPLVLIFCLVAFLVSCQQEEVQEEKNSAVITITDPIVDGHIHHNDTLKIRGTIVSTMDMHGYNASIRRTDNWTEVFYFDDHYHGQNKNLNIDWPCNVNENVQLELKMTAVLDHDGNATFKKIKFFCEM